jgi:hypothetical protein
MMTLKKQIKIVVCLLIALTLLVEVLGCGTLMYPERRGQKSGRIDPGVAIFDGIGLLFFIIPGLIAYAVDFTTGAIYLPGGHRSSDPMRVVTVTPKELNQEKIKEVLIREAGCPRHIRLENAEVYVLDRSESIPAMLADAASVDFRTR